MEKKIVYQFGVASGCYSCLQFGTCCHTSNPLAGQCAAIVKGRNKR